MKEYDIIIIGGGVAGLTAGMYASRAGAKTLIIEENYIGGIVTTLSSVENFPGIQNFVGLDFVNNLFMQTMSAGAEIIIDRITEIDFDKKIVLLKNNSVSYKSLIFATGSSCRKLNALGEDVYFQKGVSYCAVCDGALYKNKNVVVITNGSTASKEIDFLLNLTKNIVVLDISKTYTNSTLQVYNGVTINEIIGKENVSQISFKQFDKDINIDCDGVFVCLGREYNDRLYKGVVDTNDGFIVTNEQLATSKDGVFAVGDIRLNSLKQIIGACSDGARGALSAIKYIKK